MRLRIFLILLGAALVVATYTFPFWRPLLVNQVDEELFPGLPANLQAGFAQIPPEQQAIFLQMAGEDQAMAVAMVAAALEPPVAAPEEDPPDAAAAIQSASGEFRQIDAVRWARGDVTVYTFPDNRKLLRFEEFEAASGPDLRVILSASANPLTREEVEFSDLDLDLGRLKGNVGDQNYEIPPEVDLSLYNSVVIYSSTYHVVFSTATI